MAKGNEEQARREAVRRVMTGEPVAAVAAEMGRSGPWVRKWMGRYDPTNNDWATSRSRAPRVVANRTETETEMLVVKIRQKLSQHPWAQVGASAIAWELDKLDVDDPPAIRTIERILVRHDVERRPRRQRYVPKGTPYPTPEGTAPNVSQQADLVGPRHLDGGDLFYAVNVVDVARRKAGGHITTSKSAPATVDALITVWQHLGVPQRLQLDNQQALAGAGRQPGILVRLCLTHGIIPTFIPFAEPWRNGIVEHFNDTFDKKFFRTERFTDRHRLVDRYHQFLIFHNATHRYSALGGKTPDQTEHRFGFTPRPPDPNVAAPATFEGLSGQVDYIRLIRSDRQLRILDHTYTMPDEVVYEYVTATLLVEHHQLAVVHHNREIARFPFPLK